MEMLGIKACGCVNSLRIMGMRKTRVKLRFGEVGMIVCQNDDNI